jgi:hypothetical protein
MDLALVRMNMRSKTRKPCITPKCTSPQSSSACAARTRSVSVPRHALHDQLGHDARLLGMESQKRKEGCDRRRIRRAAGRPRGSIPSAHSIRAANDRNCRRLALCRAGVVPGRRDRREGSGGSKMSQKIAAEKLRIF